MYDIEHASYLNMLCYGRWFYSIFACTSISGIHEVSETRMGHQQDYPGSYILPICLFSIFFVMLYSGCTINVLYTTDRTVAISRNLAIMNGFDFYEYRLKKLIDLGKSQLGTEPIVSFIFLKNW